MMIVDNFFTDGETETTSFIFGLWMKAHKRLKYFFCIHLVKTNAIISDLNFIIFLIRWKIEKTFFIFPDWPRTYADIRRDRSIIKLDRIFKKIFKKLPVLNITAFHYRQWIYLNRCAFFFDLFIHHIQCLLDN